MNLTLLPPNPHLVQENELEICHGCQDCSTSVPSRRISYCIFVYCTSICSWSLCWQSRPNRYHTQPVDGTAAADEDRRRARPVSSHNRHHTQPITPGEKEEAENAAEIQSDSDSSSSGRGGGSIADRYRATPQNFCVLIARRDAVLVSLLFIHYITICKLRSWGKVADVWNTGRSTWVFGDYCMCHRAVCWNVNLDSGTPNSSLSESLIMASNWQPSGSADILSLLSPNRLAALQKSGEEEWRKRLSRSSPAKDQATLDLMKQVKRRDKVGNLADRPSSIADRLSWLEGSQTTWTKRVEEKDNKKFTVEGKMSRAIGGGWARFWRTWVHYETILSRLGTCDSQDYSCCIVSVGRNV